MSPAQPTNVPAAAMPVDDAFRRALDTSFAIRVTHRGRRSGLPRVLETTYYWDGAGKIYLSGYPGKRDWVANMGAAPDVTVYTVERGHWFAAPATARVLRSREERTPYVMAYVRHWLRLGGGQRRLIRWTLAAARVNRALHLPWWGPFFCIRRVFDAMPCVELKLAGEPVPLDTPPPDPTLPRSTGEAV